MATGRAPMQTGVRSSASYRVLGITPVVSLLPDCCFAQALVRSGFLWEEPHTAEDLTARPLWHVLSDQGVTVGVICPSTTRTEFQDRIRRAGPGQKRVRINSHSAESVVAAIVRMARSRRRGIVLSPEAKLMTFLNAVAPGILDRILGRVLKGD